MQDSYARIVLIGYEVLVVVKSHIVFFLVMAPSSP
jgi:hypothetical protein